MVDARLVSLVNSQVNDLSRNMSEDSWTSAKDLRRSLGYKDNLGIVLIHVVDQKLHITLPNGLRGEDHRLVPILDVILAICQHFIMPDVALLLNFWDLPLFTQGTSLPVFSFTGTEDSADLLVPTIFTPDVVRAGGLTQLPVRSWPDRHDRIVWRGSRTSAVRTRYVALSERDNGTNFDIRFSPPLIPLQDQLTSRYILVVDGTSAAWRLAAQLAQTVTVFKVKSKFNEHYYTLLEPYVHYIPVEEPSQLYAQLVWARSNEIQVLRIAQASTQFAREVLSVEQSLLYFMLLLELSASSRTDLKPGVEYNPDVRRILSSTLPTSVLPNHFSERVTQLSVQCRANPQHD